MGVLWEVSGAVFLLLTVLIGGGAAFMAGRSLATQWRSLLRAVLFMLPLTLAVRFFHFALFDGSLLSVRYFIVDFAVLVGATLLGYRLTRVKQMVTQYNWLYERCGPLAWRDKADR